MSNQTTTIPRGWKMTTLGEVASFSQGIQVSTENQFVQNKPGFVRFVRIVDYTNQNEIPRYIDNPGEKYFVNKDDLVMIRYGSQTAGKIVRGIEGVIANNTFKITPQDFVDKNYLFWFLRQPDIYSFLNKDQSSSTMPAITFTQVGNLEFALSSLTEQRAIAAVLSSLDDKIELLREQNKTLEATAQAIFKEWFVNFNFPGATGKMIDSEIGEIPEGWKVGKLVEEGLSELVKTNIDNFKGTKDYVETANVILSYFVGNFEKITYEKRASRANMQPVSNSIWFARMAESRKYLLFQERDWQNIETKILSTGFAGIRCIKDYLYFYWCFILSNTFNDLKNQFAEGAVQVAISNGGIQRILLALPPKEVAQKFTETVSFCFEKISNNNSQIETLSSFRDALLPKLMKGEVRVKGFKD